MWNIFKKKAVELEFKPEYGLGALANPDDIRDVSVSAFQKEPVYLPENYITDISMLPRYDQKSNGSCVGHAVALAIAYYDWKELKKFTKPSPRFIYGLAKKIDGLINEGTYPRVGGSIAKDKGCATVDQLPNDSYLSHTEYITFELTDTIISDAYPRRIKGYAFVDANLDAIKSAIINNGVVCVSLKVGKWNKLPVKPGDRGRHYIMVYGYKKDTFLFANSWGSRWGENGNGTFKFDDFKDNIRDIMVITDIPNEVLQKAKDKWPYKYFAPTERTGSYGTCADLDPKLLRYIDTIRGMAGISFKPTSGYRTKEVNDRVGGAPKSAHLKRLAIDILATTEGQKSKIKDAVKRLENSTGQKCFLEIAKSHIHIDLDASIHKLGTIMYSDDD